MRDQDWKNISPSAKDFVLKCLNRDAASRASVKDLFEEPWIKAWIADPVVSDKTALVVTDALVSFRKAGIL
jgi:serine/threonine protein kinase